MSVLANNEMNPAKRDVLLLLRAINRLLLAEVSDSIPGCEGRMRGRFREQPRRVCADVR